MLLYDGQLKTYDFKIDKVRKYHKKQSVKSETVKYCESIITFDIETTSAFLENDKVIPYRKGKSAEYWNSLKPLALCYIWQCSVDGTVYYGRELKDFLLLLKDLPTDINYIIWVHNLAWEFQFLQNILSFDKVFARSPHKPMYAVSKEYPNITFRCSYVLTRLSLDSWGKQIGIHKKKGQLDYDLIRTPLTPMTDLELEYCEYDCLVLEAGIKKYVERYQNQRSIPLTQTGTVRNVVKDMLMSDEEYAKDIKKLVPPSADFYTVLIKLFAGGYTHANRFYAGSVVTGTIEHYDFASSYPTVLCAEKYPITPWVYIGHKQPNPKTYEDKAYIFHVRFSGVQCITFNTYIQASKCENGRGYVFDNGRVISADYFEMYVTEQDMLTITETYKIKRIEYLHIWQSYKGYLPKELVSYILELYGNKTSLKDVDGFEDLYMQSKQYINSMFGMMVTAIVQSDIEYKDGNWEIGKLTKEDVNEKLYRLRHSWKGDKRYFLSYSWGVWCTAYARRNLWKCITPNDFNVLYCDTDSIFLNKSVDFSWYNKEIIEKLDTALTTLNLDPELSRPKTPKGKVKQLGIFDKEDDCSEFITLGAKRYVERRISDGELHLTVSGINKEAVKLLNNDISNFRDGFDFDKDADCVTKKLSTYISDQGDVVWPDGYVSTDNYGINLRRTGYNLSMTDEYKALLDSFDLDIRNLPERAMIRLRGAFI